MKKDDKKIINEINRLNELMGLNKKLLNEQAWVDDLLTGLIQAGAKQGDEITTLVAKLSDDTLTTLEKTDVLEDIIRIAQREGNDDLLLAINTQLIRSGGRLMNQLDKIIVNNRTLIQSGIDRGASKSDLQKIFADDFNPNTGDDILDELIKRQLKNKVGKEYDKLISTADDITSTTPRITTDPETPRTRVTTDEPTPKTGDDAAETGARESGDDAAETGARELSGKEIEKSINDLQNTPWDKVPLISEEVANHMITTPNRGAFGRWVRGDFRQYSTILTEKVQNIRKLSKLYTETNNSTLKARLENKIKTDLYELAKNNRKLIEDTNSELTDVIGSFERNNRGGIINPNEKRFAEYIGDLRKETDGFKVSKIMNLTSEGRKGLTVLGDAFSASLPGNTKWINTVKNITKSVKEMPAKIVGKEIDKATKETMDKITSNRLKTKNWLVSGSPRGNPWRSKHQINYIEIIEKGGLSAAKKSYVLELVFRLIQWKVLFAVIFTFRNYLSYLTMGSGKRDMIEKCLSSQNKKVDCLEIDTFWERWALDFMEGSKESQMRWIKDFVDQTFGNNTGDEITDYFPGKIDDLAAFLYRFLITSADDEFIKELEDNLENNLESAEEGIETTTQEIENTLEEEGIDVSQTDDEDSTPESSSEITNTLDGLSTQFGYPKEEMSPQTYNGTGEIEIWGMKFVYDSTNKKFTQK